MQIIRNSLPALPKPTEEQELICAHPLKSGSMTGVTAYAGTGKTTTFRLKAACHPDMRMLYFCFNNSVAASARKVFPRNVTCITQHSLAMRGMGPFFEGSGKEIGRDLRTLEIKELLETNSPFTAIYVRQTLAEFLRTTDEHVTLDHAGHMPKKAGSKEDVVRLTQSLWDQMRDPNSAVPIPHDGYLKLYVMEDFELPNADVIMLDEAQDTNPITAELVRRQRERGKAIILVGDPHQSIYRFRGATNFMEQALASGDVAQFQLTTSFRLRQSTADIASDLLNAWKDDPVRIKGFATKDRGDETKVIISRTNGRLIEEANMLLEAGVERIHFAGTNAKDKFDPTNAYSFAAMRDVHHLWAGQPSEIKTGYFKRFETYEDLKFIAESKPTRDAELYSLVNFTEKWGEQTPGLLDRLRKVACGPEGAQVTLSSAHRSKGLEWDHVTITDDFMNLCDAALHQEELTEEEFGEEVNLIYVAATRSQDKLVLPESVEMWRSAYLRGEEPEMSEKGKERLKYLESLRGRPEDDEDEIPRGVRL